MDAEAWVIISRVTAAFLWSLHYCKWHLFVLGMQISAIFFLTGNWFGKWNWLSENVFTLKGFSEVYWVQLRKMMKTNGSSDDHTTLILPDRDRGCPTSGISRHAVLVIRMSNNVYSALENTLGQEDHINRIFTALHLRFSWFTTCFQNSDNKLR